MSQEYYIGYEQAEKLLYKYPQLKSLLRNLQIELEKTYQNSGELNESDILYSLSIGNRVLSDMPHPTSQPGDKMAGIIQNKDKVINNEYVKELIYVINTIGEVVEKTAIALESLTNEEKEIIELRYFQRKEWKDISEIVSLSPARLGERKKSAVLEMIKVLRVKGEQWAFCMEKVKG